MTQPCILFADVNHQVLDRVPGPRGSSFERPAKVLTLLKRAPLAAPIFAVAYVINAGVDAGVSIDVVLRPGLMALAGGAAVATVAVLALRSPTGGNVVACIAVAAVISAGPAGTIFTKAQPLQAVIWLLLLATTAALAIRILRRHWTQSDRAGLSGFANLFALFVLAIVVGTALVARTDPVADAHSAAEPSAPASARDLVLILLDGYPRGDILETYFGFDNEQFLSELSGEGFVVAPDAKSNYAWTELTLLSMLHMQLATDLPQFEERASTDRSQPWLRELTARNPVFAIVREAGYSVVTVATNIHHVTLRSADRVYRPPGLTDFDLHLIRSTALAGLVSLFDPAFAARSHHDQVSWAIDTIQELASDAAGGRLLIGHVLSPHMPAVFNADGTLRVVPFDDDFSDDFRALTDTGAQEWKAAFLSELTWLNQRVLGAVKAIVAANPDADVVLMSDHGTGLQYRPDVPDVNVAERYSTLFAARTPGIASPFSTSQTPVNAFPSWFNARLGTRIQQAPDGAYAGYLQLSPLPPVAGQ